MSVHHSRFGSSILAVLRSPLLWLLVQLGVATWFLATNGELDYRRVPDTASYLAAADADSLPVALSQYRTIAYPAFLELFRGPDGVIHLHRVGQAHWLLYGVSILLFFVGLGRLGGSRWLAFAAATPLVYSPMRLLVDRVQPDFLASAAVLAAFALLFLLLERATMIRWIAFGVMVFLSYQLRPAGLFLVFLLPLVAGLTLWIGSTSISWRATRFAVRIALATLLPLLAFNGVRWLAVGHFGLVSFGGFNAMGVAACFLDGQLVNDLPEDDQHLARSILRARKERNYEAMSKSDDPRDYFEQYSPNVFSIAVTTTRKQLSSERPEGGLSPDWAVEANRRLSTLAGEILRRRPFLYANWIRAALLYGTEQLVRWLWISLPSIVLLILLPLRALRGARALHATDDESRRHTAVFALVLSGSGFFFAYLLAVSLVSFPFERYFLSMILLLPSVLMTLVFEMARSILPLDPAERGSDGAP